MNDKIKVYDDYKIRLYCKSNYRWSRLFDGMGNWLRAATLGNMKIKCGLGKYDSRRRKYYAIVTTKELTEKGLI